MRRFIIVVLATALGLGPTTAGGQDADQVTRLRQEMELLKKEVDVLKRENALLQKENDNLKKENDDLKKENDTLRKVTAGSKTPAPKAGTAKTLPDLLVEGTVLKGTFLNSGRRGGICTLTIKERTGDKFKGVGFHKIKDGQGEGPDVEYEVGGSITADGVTYRTVGSPFSATISGKRKGDYLELNYADSLGATAKASMKLPK